MARSEKPCVTSSATVCPIFSTPVLSSSPKFRSDDTGPEVPGTRDWNCVASSTTTPVPSSPRENPDRPDRTPGTGRLKGLLMEKGTSRRRSTTPQSTGNTNFGSLFFSAARSASTIAIMTLP